MRRTRAPSLSGMRTSTPVRRRSEVTMPREAPSGARANLEAVAGRDVRERDPALGLVRALAEREQGAGGAFGVPRLERGPAPVERVVEQRIDDAVEPVPVSLVERGPRHAARSTTASGSVRRSLKKVMCDSSAAAIRVSTG